MARSTPGTRMRRQTAKELQEVRNRLDWVKRVFSPRSTVYISQEDRKPGDNAYLRPREPHEYPENNTAKLTQAYGQVNAAINALTEIRERLAQRYHEVLAQQQTEGAGK